MSGTHPEPTNDLEEAADVAFRAIEAYLELNGLTLEKAIISLKVAEHPETGDAVTATHNIDSPEDALYWMMGQLRGFAHVLGFDIHLARIGRG